MGRDTDATPQSQIQDRVEWIAEQYRGTNSQLQTFIERTWSNAYEGRMAFPVWTTEYFDWQLGQGGGLTDRRLAVYDSEELIAVLLGSPQKFLLDGAVLDGAHWSWLSVNADYKGHRLAKRLDAKRAELERQAGSDLIASYRFTGSKHSLAERPNQSSPLKQFHSKLGFWARPLDAMRLKRWNVNRVEGFLSQLVLPFLKKPRNNSRNGVIRDYQPKDLPTCTLVAQKHHTSCSLSIYWDDETLSRQLNATPISQTLVAEVEDKIAGFVNFHLLEFQGRTREPVGIIDIAAISDLPGDLQQSLLLNVLHRMREQGAILALKLKCGDVKATAMLKTGFMPRLPDSHLVFQWTNTIHPVNQKAPLHLLWR